MEQNTRRLLAKRLRHLREQHGLTQQMVAEKSGLDYKYYQTIESKQPPNVTIDTLERLARAFRLSPSKLLKP